MNVKKTSVEKLAYAREYRRTHSTELQKYRDDHRDEKKAYNDAYLISNRETLKAKSTRYFDERPGYKAMAYKRWADANKDKNRARKRKYDKERRQTDPLFRLQTNLRARIYQALKSHKPPSNRTMKSVGCTVQFLKGWIESRWLPRMSWDNYNQHGWHVDHVIPCSAFDLSNLDEARQCFHYTNLQPLWAKDNLRKSNFAPDGAQPKTNPKRERTRGESQIDIPKCRKETRTKEA